MAEESAGGASRPRLTESDIQWLRSHVRLEKKQIIAENMRLPEAQAKEFWAVHDGYTQETMKLSDLRFALIKEFAQSYDTMTDAQADDLVKRMAALEQQVPTLRQRWIPRFRKVLTGKQTATFFQVDRRMNLVIDLQIAAWMPLVK